MSFGFSISDIALLAQLTTRTYDGWKKACGDYASITCDLVVLQTLLRRMETEAKAPNSLFTRNADDVRGWKSLSKGCRNVVMELEAILDKYRSLSTNRRRNWDRIRLGNKNLDSLGQELVKRTASLAAFASIVGVSSQARVENEVFPELVQKIDDIAEQVRKGNASVNTMTTYANDDKGVWREFRRDMISSGIRSSDIHRYSSALRTHLARLERDGMLEEPIPEGSLDEEREHKAEFDEERDDEAESDEESSSWAEIDDGSGATLREMNDSKAALSEKSDDGAVSEEVQNPKEVSREEATEQKQIDEEQASESSDNRFVNCVAPPHCPILLTYRFEQYCFSSANSLASPEHQFVLRGGCHGSRSRSGERRDEEGTGNEWTSRG